MREIDQELQAADKLLTVLLSGGRHNAGSTLDALREAAQSLAAYGLDATADLVRAVVEAPDPGGSLSAITLASAAIALLRARLPDTAAPEEAWTPLVEPDGGGTKPRLLLLARAQIAGERLWTGLRLHGNRLSLVLLELGTEVSPQSGQPLDAGTQFSAVLAWRATLPLPAAPLGWYVAEEIDTRIRQSSKLLSDQWSTALSELEDRSLQVALRPSDTWHERRNDAGLQMIPAADALGAGARWLDRSMQESWGASLRPGLRALCWVEGGSVLPLALVESGTAASSVRVGMLRLFSKEPATTPAKLIHLVPGSPVSELG